MKTFGLLSPCSDPKPGKIVGFSLGPSETMIGVVSADDGVKVVACIIHRSPTWQVINLERVTVLGAVTGELALRNVSEPFRAAGVSHFASGVVVRTSDERLILVAEESFGPSSRRRINFNLDTGEAVGSFSGGYVAFGDWQMIAIESERGEPAVIAQRAS